MKKNFIILLLALAALNLQNCTSINNFRKQNKKIEFEIDNKTILLKPPTGYCIYDKSKPSESDVIKIIRESNYNDVTKIDFVFQECEEKKSFLDNEKPQFRSTGMIIFPIPSYLKDLKKYRLERSRDFYLNVVHEQISTDTVDSLNKFMDDVSIPHMKKHNDLKIIEKSTNLKPQQKAELKLLHDFVFGNSKTTFTQSFAKLEKNRAVYDHQEYKVKDITTRCIGAETLIRYIPVTLVICEDKKSEDWKNLEEKIQKC